MYDLVGRKKSIIAREVVENADRLVIHIRRGSGQKEWEICEKKGSRV